MMSLTHVLTSGSVTLQFNSVKPSFNFICICRLERFTFSLQLFTELRVESIENSIRYFGW